MTDREHGEPALPDVLVVVGSAADASVLAALGVPDELVRPVLVATGPDPMLVDDALADLEAPAGRILLLDGPCEGSPAETAALLPRLDALVAESGPAAVVVRGGSSAALAATHAAVWRNVPVVALSAPGASGAAAANQAAIAELAAWQTSPAGGLAYPAQVDLMVHRRLEGASIVCMPTPRARSSSRSGLTA